MKFEQKKNKLNNEKNISGKEDQEVFQEDSDTLSLKEINQIEENKSSQPEKTFISLDYSKDFEGIINSNPVEANQLNEKKRKECAGIQEDHFKKAKVNP